MKRIVKIGLIAALALCLSICTMTVFATPEDDTPVVTDAPIVTQAPVTQAPVTQPPATQAPVTQAPVTQAPTRAPVYTTAPPVYTTAAPVYTSPQTYAPATQAQATQAPPATNSNMYNVEDETIDNHTLKNKDWKEIANRLKDANADEGDVDTFNFIKDNDGSSDKTTLYLTIGTYVGIAFIVIAIVIFAILISQNKKRKKQLKKNPPKRVQGNHEPASQQRPQPQRGNQHQAPKEMSPSQKRQVKTRSKYDTDEVYIPKQRTSGNGKYRPKH